MRRRLLLLPALSDERSPVGGGPGKQRRGCGVRDRNLLISQNPLPHAAGCSCLRAVGSIGARAQLSSPCCCVLLLCQRAPETRAGLQQLQRQDRHEGAVSGGRAAPLGWWGSSLPTAAPKPCSEVFEGLNKGEKWQLSPFHTSRGGGAGSHRY